MQEVFLLLIRAPRQFDAARGSSLQAYLCGVARNRLREALEALRQAVRALPLRYREVVALCELQGLGYREAASALECAEGTVCSRLNRARALLMQKMKGYQYVQSQ